jgi:hypothetical protein
MPERIDEPHAHIDGKRPVLPAVPQFARPAVVTE